MGHSESRLLASSPDRGDYQCGFASRVVGDLRYFWRARIDRCNKKVRLVRKTRFVFRKFSCGEECMLLQGDGSPGHACIRFMISAPLRRHLEGGAKSCKNEAIPGFALAASGHKEANQLPINTDRARSCLSCIRQLQAEISAVRSGTGRVSATARDSRKAARLTPRPALHS